MTAGWAVFGGGAVGVAVGAGDALVNPPGGLDLGVVLVGEDHGEPSHCRSVSS